jgi:hypothetical protein
MDPPHGAAKHSMLYRGDLMRKLSSHLLEILGISSFARFISLWIGALGIGGILGKESLLYWILFCLIFLVFYIVILALASGEGLEDLTRSKWRSYHLSTNRDQSSKWIEGVFYFDRWSNRGRVRGYHQDINPNGHKYKLKGHVNGGILLLTEYNIRAFQRDDCFAYFYALKDPDIKFGLWLGPSNSERLTCGPYILSRDALSDAALWKHADEIYADLIIPSLHKPIDSK